MKKEVVMDYVDIVGDAIDEQIFQEHLNQTEDQDYIEALEIELMESAWIENHGQILR
jgi:hypothetical protein